MAADLRADTPSVSASVAIVMGSQSDWATLTHAADMLDKLGRPKDAAAAYEHAAALDSSGVLGVPLHLARCGTRPAPEVAPEAYLRALFDDYADHFETHLTGQLSYHGPALLQRALERLGATHFGTVVDLGCGTGLCGAQLRCESLHLTGVDLSPRMIEAARAKKIYDRLTVASIEDFLRAEPERSASLVVAADVLVYTGCLAPILSAVRRVLAPGGRFACTLQRAPTGTYCVGSDLRYAHGEDYVREIARGAGLAIRLMEQVPIRTEAGEPVPGLVVIAD